MHIKEFSKEMLNIMPLINASFIRKLPASFKEGRLTISQMLILEMLRAKKECRMSDISKSLGVTKSAITAITDRLIKAHLVKRVRSQDDRRVVTACLRPQGLKLSNKLQNHKLRVISALFSNISREERTQYLSILRKVQKNLASKPRRKSYA
ncbi:MAG: MarR family transcriptional regulator [Candidatus Omnitrophota bacterium]